MIITFEDITTNQTIKTYIAYADETLAALGFTEHSYAHTMRCANDAEKLLLDLGYSARTAELAKIAGYMHDIGNVINRVGHAQSGGIMAFTILSGLGMPPHEVAQIAAAIGHHDEATAFPVNPIAAALILADKSDVRRGRVRNRDMASFDIHDRVNYAAEKSVIVLDKEQRVITLQITIDTTISALMDYFEIFLSRMQLCRKAADYLDLTFKLRINDTILL